jgi:hypothetical protein
MAEVGKIGYKECLWNMNTVDDEMASGTDEPRSTERKMEKKEWCNMCIEEKKDLIGEKSDQ